MLGSSILDAQRVEVGLRRRATVSIIRPPVVVMPGALATHGPTPPLGAAYVAAALRDAGFGVQLIDAAGEAIGHSVEVDSPVGPLQRIGLPLEAIADRIDPQASVVGISTMFLHEWPTVRELSAVIKQRRPDVHLVVGGENATAFHRWMLLQSDAIDCCVLGEGEATMIDLVERLTTGRPLSGLSGIATREHSSGAESEGPELPTRMTRTQLAEQAARPAWDLVPLDRYWEHYPFFGVHRGRSIEVLGTRGCPYRCSFCSSPQMWTTRYVTREPDDVVDEIAEYVERYGVQNVNFVDLTAATNRKWTLAFCDALDARGLDITWQLPVGTRIEAIDREVLGRLRDTGCRNITFAPESGSERLLAVMDKRVDLTHVLRAVAEADELGLHVTINVLIGHPQETWRDLWESVRFMLKASWLGCSDTAVVMFCPYPGSADFEKLVASGDHTIDEASYFVGLSRGSSRHRSWNPHVSARQLRLVQLAMIAGFYAVNWLRRPRRAARFLLGQVTGAEETYLDQMVRTKRRNLDPLGARRGRTARGRVSPDETPDASHDAASALPARPVAR